MKFKIIIISLLIVVFLIPVICISKELNPETWNEVWEFYERTHFYNKTKIVNSSDITSVWVYKIMTDDDRAKIIEIVKRHDLEKSEKFKDCDHQLILEEIDCQKRLYRVKELAYYDDMDKVLENNNYPDNKWVSIPPSSIVEELYNRTCKSSNETSEKQ
jgi:hypothetical protein